VTEDKQNQTFFWKLGRTLDVLVTSFPSRSYIKNPVSLLL